MSRPDRFRVFALYLSGFGVGALLMVVSFLNPTWPAWMAVPMLGVALGIGVLLAAVEPAR